MIIRQATEKDLDSLIELGEKLTKHEQKCDKYLRDRDVGRNREEYLRLLKDKKAKLIVAEEKRRIVGYIYGQLKAGPDHLKIGELGHIEACYVEESSRKQGVMKQMLKKLLSWFKDSGAEMAELGVYSNNPARIVWEKLGFSEYHREMRKEL